MDDTDWSTMIEHALQYASPLPVLEVTATDTSGSEMPKNVSGSLQLNDDIPNSTGTDNADTNSENSSSGDKLPYGHRVTMATTVNDSSRGKFLSLVPVSIDMEQCEKSGASNSVYVNRMNTDLNATHHEPVQSSSVSVNSSPLPEHTVSTSLSSSSCSPYAGSPSNVIPKVKKTRRRVKNPDPPPEPILPPCSVCDEKSSGFHYGANTCEACKGFFRRTLKKKEVRYKCKCKPDVREEWNRGPIKNGCASCRYERCLKVGMSNAIKIGRYTLQHKTENINQVKSVESIDNLIDVAMSNVFESSPSSASGLDFSVSSPEDITSPWTADESEISSSCRSYSDDSSPPTKKAKSDTISSLTPQNNIISLEEIDSIVKTLTESQKSAAFDDTGHIPAEVIKQKQTEYLEKYNMKKEMFGDMGLSKEEFDEFYNITGIDLDGRIKHVHCAFTFFEKKISIIVGFAKSIPGFKSLSLNDQANLIKASRTENTLFGGYRGILRNFDMERRVLTTPWGKEIHMDELGRIVPINFILSKFEYGQLIRDLHLTVQEESVIRAIVTMFTDRCKLEEPQKAERIQEKLVACLQHLLNIRPGGPGPMLYRIFNIITKLRDFSENETEFTRKMLQDWPMLSTNKYQLLKEFIA